MEVHHSERHGTEWVVTKPCYLTHSFTLFSDFPVLDNLFNTETHPYKVRASNTTSSFKLAPKLNSVFFCFLWYSLQLQHFEYFETFSVFAVPFCFFHNPPDPDMDYRIFNMHMWYFCMHTLVYTHKLTLVYNLMLRTFVQSAQIWLQRKVLSLFCYQLCVCVWAHERAHTHMHACAWTSMYVCMHACAWTSMYVCNLWRWPELSALWFLVLIFM